MEESRKESRDSKEGLNLRVKGQKGKQREETLVEEQSKYKSVRVELGRKGRSNEKKHLWKNIILLHIKRVLKRRRVGSDTVRRRWTGPSGGKKKN